MYSVAPTVVLLPMSQRPWKAGPQSTMLKTSRRLALTLDFGKSSTTVHKTVLPQRATRGDPGKKKLSTNLLPKNIKNATKKAVIQITERLSKLQPVSTGTASVNNIGSHIYCIVY